MGLSIFNLSLDISCSRSAIFLYSPSSIISLLDFSFSHIIFSASSFLYFFSNMVFYSLMDAFSFLILQNSLHKFSSFSGFPMDFFLQAEMRVSACWKALLNSSYSKNSGKANLISSNDTCFIV